MQSKLARVAIIGGGFSGAMTAVHLLRQKIPLLEITIFEQAHELGRGLAYSTPCPDHLLNVPAFGMSAIADEPDHFLNYAISKGAQFNRESFVPRRIFGDYLRGIILDELKIAENSGALCNQVAAAVIAIEKIDSGYLLSTSDGKKFEAEYVVLAIGNLSGKKPVWLKGIELDCKNYLHNPWLTGAIEAIPTHHNVLIVGSGLTAVDKIIELERAKHKGAIYAISRHGLFPRVHLARFQGSVDSAVSETRSSVDALHSIKMKIRETPPTEDGDTWRTVVDGLRSTTQTWWHALSIGEKKKFLRRLLTYWEVHRHRMAPGIAHTVELARTSGQLKTYAGHIESITEKETELVVSLKERVTSKLVELRVHTIINCTGPQSSLKTVDSPLLENLLKAGLVAPHDVGTGIAARADGQVLDAGGSAVDGLFAVGPLLKAELLESVAVPELKQQAYDLAHKIGDAVRKTG